jgi:hypothetical protein
MPAPELRPLSVGEIVDTAVNVVRRNARVLFTIAAVVLVPLGVLQLIFYGLAGFGDALSTFDALVQNPDLVTAEEAQAALDAAAQLAIVGFAFGVLALFAIILVGGATVQAAAGIYQGLEPSWQDSVRTGLRRLGAMVVASLAVAIGAGSGLLLLILPGVWLFTSWAVTIPALIVEGRGPFAAMRRSFQLVKPRFWPTLGVVILATVLYVVVSYVINLVGSVMTLADPFGTGSIVASVISSTIASIVVFPFIAAVLIVHYFDLRVRAEGYDLEVMARELLEAESPSPTTSPDPDDPFGLGPPDRA